MAIVHSLTWIKCQGNQWCDLFRVDLSSPHFEGLGGVYIIWHAGENPRTAYVGQGMIAQHIRAHQADPRNVPYRYLGLFITWAQVAPSDRDGVERYLADTLRPLIAERHPDVPPTPVNSPWL